MTKTEIDVLSRLIQADRDFHTAKANGELTSLPDRGVEVGPINSVPMRVANSLVNAGLAEMACLHNNRPYLFLGKYEAYDR